jgi:hypothetical protein
LRRAIFGLIVADDSTTHDVSRARRGRT